MGGVSGAGGVNSAALQQLQSKLNDASATVEAAGRHVEMCKASLGAGPERLVRSVPAAEKTVFERIGAAITGAMDAISSFFKGLSNRTATVDTLSPKELTVDTLSPKEFVKAQRELQTLESSHQGKAMGRNYLTGSPEFRAAFYAFAKTEYSTENLDFLGAFSSQGLKFDKDLNINRGSIQSGMEMAFADINLQSKNRAPIASAVATLNSLGIANFNAKLEDASDTHSMSVQALNNQGELRSEPLTAEQNAALGALENALGVAMREVVALASKDTGARFIQSDLFKNLGEVQQRNERISTLKEQISSAETQTSIRTANRINPGIEHLASLTGMKV